jgi:hypothetical protein
VLDAHQVVGARTVVGGDGRAMQPWTWFSNWCAAFVVGSGVECVARKWGVVNGPRALEGQPENASAMCIALSLGGFRAIPDQLQVLDAQLAALRFEIRRGLGATDLPTR